MVQLLLYYILLQVFFFLFLVGEEVFSVLVFLSTMFCNKILSTSFPLKSRTTTINPLHFSLVRKPSYKYSYTTATIGNGVFPLSKTLIQRRLSSSSSRRGLWLVAPCTSENRGPEEEGDYSRRALETVFKLYTAVKNRNLHELSNILGDECSCVSNFFSSFQPCHGKKQVLEFFFYLMRNLGTNFEFIVQPTLHDGMNIGVSWRLEWKNNHVPLMKGISFYTCHVYQGKVVIRNVEMFIEPLLHIEPIRLIMACVMNALDKMGSYRVSEEGARKWPTAYALPTLFFMAALLFLVMLS